MVVVSFLGIRTKAIVDTMQARNWRLAREIAEAQMSILQAGAHDTPPESDVEISLADKYEKGWAYKIVLGEGAVSAAESELAELAAGDDEEAAARAEWEQNRDRYRRASRAGLSATEYDDKLMEDELRRLEEQVPSEDEFEEVAVIVYFPKLDADFRGQRDALMIRAKVSTLAISGLTSEQAQVVASSRGEGAPEGSGTALPGENR